MPTLNPETKARYDEIAREMNDSRFFTRRELNHLPTILDPTETVLAFTSGMTEGKTWLIALTDRRILMLDKGMFFGMKQVSIDLEKVNSIQGEIGIMFGKVIVSDGSRAYEIDNVPKRSVTPFTNKVRTAMSARRSASGAQPGEDRVTRLERLAALKASGVIDEAEFQAEKARIIG